MAKAKPPLESYFKSPIQKEDLAEEAHKKFFEAMRGPKGKDGADGKDGKDGRDGRDGFDGLDGTNGVDGKDGKKGDKGDRGERGFTGEKGDPGRDGVDGRDGKNGSPDKPEDIVAKIHKAKIKIKQSAVEGLEDRLTSHEKTVASHARANIQMGGPSQLLIKSSGKEVGRAPAINFTGATITTTGAGNDAVINVAVTGGGGSSINPQTPSGTVNGTNTSFTCTGIVQVAFADGLVDTGASITGSTNSTIVYSVPPQNSVFAL